MKDVISVTIGVGKIDSKTHRIFILKNYLVILFLCFFSNTFAHNGELVVSKQVDSISIDERDTMDHLTHSEIQKLKAYSLEISHIKNEKQYLNKMHSFTKDSLQILTVKLISVKELNSKKLLDKDIARNMEFYVALLKDLKESDMAPTEYLFLENKLSKFLINEAEIKYAYSKWLNIILGILLIILCVFIAKSKRKETPVLSLSKQETTIKTMIIEGKSNKEIAEELFISLSTVKTHITNIYKKLNISNRVDLISKFKNTPRTST